MVAETANVKQVALDYISRTVELANTTKRLAQLAIGYFIETVMARALVGEGNSSILEEILFQGSQKGHNGGIAFCRGVVSSIVFHRGSKISVNTIESVRQMAQLPDISNFYLDRELLSHDRLFRTVHGTGSCTCAQSWMRKTFNIRQVAFTKN